MEDDAVIEKLPNLEYAHWKFLLSQPDEVSPATEKAELKGKLLEAIKSDNMAPFYQIVCEDLKWSVDSGLLQSMKKANQEELQKLEDAVKDAKENLGESEVREAMLKRANHYARIGDKDNAMEQFRLTEEATIGSGQRLDVVFTQIRIGLFFLDFPLIARTIERAKGMIEAGSDWDRKNRLKVYEAIYLLSIRKFEPAANLLLETISTFTAVELLEYDRYIFYTVLMAVVSLDRVTLKNKVINAPEILQVIEQMPHLGSLMNSFYNLNYASFFTSLAQVTEEMKRNRFLASHAGFYCKEMRVKGYLQLLESYRSVQLPTMATAFGVTEDFLDRELSRFIASGRLYCKIDKVNGVVETTRHDSKNADRKSVV